MQVQVSYSTQIRPLVGSKDETVELAGDSTLADLLKTVCETHGGELRAALLDDAGQLRSALFVSVNDNHVYDLATHTLQEGDSVIIMSAISGG